MISRNPVPELHVPLERLHRIEPLRTWEVAIEVSQLQADDNPLQVGDVSIVESRNVRVELTLDQVREGVTVAGVITAAWNGECSRCLRPVEGVATADVEELFEEHPREGESYPLGEEFIDLEPMVRDALLLELPVGVVRCSLREECSRLAPHYSSSSEQGDGSEEVSTVDPRWAPLDSLNFDEQKDPETDVP